MLGNLEDARSRVKDLLERDPYNYRVVQLFCEVQRYAKDPLPVLDFVGTHAADLARFSSAAQVSLAEALRSVAGPKNVEARRLARQLVSMAAVGKFEVAEVRQLSVAMLDLGQDQEALSFLNRATEDRPEWRHHPGLLQLRGRALIQLTKRCSQNARDPALSSRLKARAWDECRRYLDEAAHALRTALEHGPDQIVREHVNADMDFLQTLRRIAEKPQTRGR